MATTSGESATWRARTARRLLTVPSIFVGLALLTTSLPVLLPLALALDALRSGGLRARSTSRLVVFLEAYLAIDALGLLALGGVFVLSIGAPERRARMTWTVQRHYTRSLMAALRAVFSLRFTVEGDELARGGPLLVLIRHASIADVLLPGVFLADRHRLRLRYVLKRELLLEPCLDVAGHWIPNRFVARDGADTEREVEAVRALKSGLTTDEGVLLYPEGTCFTTERRERALARVAGDPIARARTERLRHLLPCRTGGVQALLETAPACDVLFVGHHGLEGLATLGQIARGGLERREIRLRYWREPAASVPTDRVGREAWLAERWQRLDDWLGTLDAKAR